MLLDIFADKSEKMFINGSLKFVSQVSLFCWTGSCLKNDGKRGRMKKEREKEGQRKKKERERKMRKMIKT